MNTLEDDIRAVLHSQANAMEVPEPHLSRFISLTRVLPQPRRRHLVPMKVTDVSVDTPTSEIRNRRRPVMAAAAVVVVIGVAAIVINNTSSDDGDAPLPAAAPTVAPTTVAIPSTLVAAQQQGPGEAEGFFAGDGGVRVTFTVPQYWWVYSGSLVHHLTGPGSGMPAVAFFEVTNIYADPCNWVLAIPPVGPTVDDLVAALANVPGYAATAAVDVTVDGYVGKQIEFTVPYNGYTEAECGGNQFAQWYATDAAPFSRFKGPGPDEHHELWILDVDGTRAVIDAISLPDTSPQDQAALDEVLASIQIG